MVRTDLVRVGLEEACLQLHGKFLVKTLDRFPQNFPADTPAGDTLGVSGHKTYDFLNLLRFRHLITRF